MSDRLMQFICPPIQKFRYKRSALDKIAAAGHVAQEPEVYTVRDFDDALAFINSKYPGAGVSYADMEVLP